MLLSFISPFHPSAAAESWKHLSENPQTSLTTERENIVCEKELIFHEQNDGDDI